VDSFNSFYNQFTDAIVKGPNTRTQKGVTGVSRLHQNLVPKYKLHDRTKIEEVERLKGTGGRWEKVTPQRATEIIKYFKVYDWDYKHPKILGRTGVRLLYDVNTNDYWLHT
jgi:hypothetical protein